MAGGDFKDDFHIVVIGAGLVGLAAASFLRKAGFPVTVLERDAELHTIGAGIQLPANSTRVLKDLGLLERVQAKSVRPPSMLVHSWRGSELLKIDLDPYAKDKYDVDHLVCHRADLRQILFDDTISRGVKVELGANIDPAKTDWTTGHVFFNNDDIQAGLIIGADGEHSMSREAILGQANPPKPIGRVANRILIHAERANSALRSLMDPPAIHGWLGPDSQAVCYTLKNVLNFVLIRAAQDEKVTFGPQSGDVAELYLFFKDWDPRIRELLNISHGFAKWMLFEPDELTDWVHKGRKLVLVGDAAHATSPHLAQGAALGFESASVLAELLNSAKHECQIPELLKRYNSIRQPRTSMVIHSSERMAQIMHLPDGPLQVERDRLIKENKRITGFPIMLAEPVFQEWLWGYDAKEAAERARRDWSDGEGKGSGGAGDNDDNFTPKL